jgi:hypothetical protein
LGYFSVSAISSKRIFIEDNFPGLVNLYSNCISDTIFNGVPISGLNTFAWIIGSGSIYPTAWIIGPGGLLQEIFLPPISYVLITKEKSCADCTARGTTTEPDFWNAGK